MPTLLSLPTELLCQIVYQVDSADLKDLRLACKPLRDAANRPFGITYFKHCRHVLTPTSVEALLEIVAHPALGSYVRSISMIALAPVPSNLRPTPEELSKAYVNSRSYVQLMKQVFTKIRGHQNSVHISIRGRGVPLGLGWHDMLRDATVVLHPCHTATLDNTLLAAIRANCHVRSVKLQMHQHKFADLHDVLEDLLSPTRPPLRLFINCYRKRTGILHCPYMIDYDQADQSLKLDGCDVCELARAREGSSIKKLLGFLLAQTTQLILRDCHLCSEWRFVAFLALDQTNALSQNLTSVRMHTFHPCRSDPDTARRRWSGILRSLCGLAGLKHFVIEDLDYTLDWDLFHLPSTTQKYEVSGEDVAEQLEALAAIVATEPKDDTSSDQSDAHDLGMN